MDDYTICAQPVSLRELKYNFDLKYFPCQKLVANKAYGVIAAFAYNLCAWQHLPQVMARKFTLQNIHDKKGFS